jgi:hypothetical protein
VGTTEDQAVEFGETSGCTERTEVILWTASRSLMPVAQHLAADRACTHYYYSIPLLAADKTRFHGDSATEIARVHALGPTFHAVAEFNISAWRDWVKAGNGTWYDAGVEFRHRAQAAGFDMFPGNSDTWFAQEFPSTLVYSSDAAMPSSQVRANMLEAVHGLWDGGDLVNKMGITTRLGSGSDVSDENVLRLQKQRLAAFLSDGAFWRTMSQYVRWWTEEVYPDPHDSCVGSASPGLRAQHINDYAFLMTKLAEEGGDATADARAFFRRSWTPLLNAAWGSNVGYGNNLVSADSFDRFLSTEVYSTVAWSDAHPEPGRRIGFAWQPAPIDPTSLAEVDVMGDRLAAAINDAYQKGASYACSPSGAYTWCTCDLPSAHFLSSWRDVYASW